MIQVFNRTDADTKGYFGGMFSYTVPAHGSLEVVDHVEKKKVPTINGEVMIDVVTPALQIAKSMVADYSRPGLDFTFEGVKYSYQKEEKVPFLIDSEVVKALGGN